jgi:hypothetical protein
MRTFDRVWNPEAPTGLFDYFRTRRTWDEKNYGKLTSNDILFLNQGRERFGNAGVEELYQKWRTGQTGVAPGPCRRSCGQWVDLASGHCQEPEAADTSPLTRTRGDA